MPDQATSSDWLPPEFRPGLVSVVIPTFNRSQLLRETLRSLLKQAYRPLEVIVVDDGSTDDTLQMLQQLQVPAGVKLQTVPGKHAGASAARNRGAEHTRGEFVMFLDSDDLLHDDAMSALVNAAGDADLVYGWWRDWFALEQPQRWSEPIKRDAGEDLLSAILRINWLLPSATLHRRKSLQRISGWDESFSAEDDFDFMVRVAISGAKARACNALVADYRRHGTGQLSEAAKDAKPAATERVLRALEATLNRRGWTTERRQALAWRWFWEARLAWDVQKDATRFERLVGEAQRVDPDFRAPKSWYRWVAAIAGFPNAERVASIARKLLR